MTRMPGDYGGRIPEAVAREYRSSIALEEATAELETLAVKWHKGLAQRTAPPPPPPCTCSEIYCGDGGWCPRHG